MGLAMAPRPTQSRTRATSALLLFGLLLRRGAAFVDQQRWAARPRPAVGGRSLTRPSLVLSLRPEAPAALVSRATAGGTGASYLRPEEFQLLVPTTALPTTQPSSTTKTALADVAVSIDSAESPVAAVRRLLSRGTGNFAGLEMARKKFARTGVSFALTYSMISNLNGSVSLSVAWYLASMQTGLSPLLPGNRKSLLAAYGGLYLLITLMRPMRLAIAAALTKRMDDFLDRVQSRFGCSRARAIGVQVSLSMLLWLGSAAAGVLTASALSGVPILP